MVRVPAAAASLLLLMLVLMRYLWEPQEISELIS